MNRIATYASLAGAILGLAAVSAGLRDSAPVSAAGDYRVYLPQLAADSAPTVSVPPTATSSTTAATGQKCGVERWTVKTLSDAAALSVNFSPQDTSVSALRLLLAPGVGDNTPRISGVEFTTYRVTATLQKAKVEDDKDIHLVIADPSNGSATMIVELPDVSCSGAINSAKKAEMAAARSAFVAACGQPGTGSFKNLSGTAMLTGVGFFDQIHGQTGVAPNGIELHPILSFSGSCSGSAAPTNTGSASTPTLTPLVTTATPLAAYYSLPACYAAGQNSCNCSNFTTHAYAQWFHDTYDPTDVNRLDSDHDGVVCESLP